LRQAAEPWVLTTLDLPFYEMVDQLEFVCTKEGFHECKSCETVSSIGRGEVGVVQGPQVEERYGKVRSRDTPSFVICPVSVQTGCRNEQAPF
jgi:hypothetical protein